MPQRQSPNKQTFPPSNAPVILPETTADFEVVAEGGKCNGPSDAGGESDSGTEVTECITNADDTSEDQSLSSDDSSWTRYGGRTTTLISDAFFTMCP